VYALLQVPAMLGALVGFGLRQVLFERWRRLQG
jgi:hypothetical protein